MYMKNLFSIGDGFLHGADYNPEQWLEYPEILDKDIEFNDNSKLSVLFGAGYYHEFADPYKGIDASINNTIGHYKLRHIENINSRDRGMLSAKVNYDYKDFSIYGELMQYLEKEYPLKLDVGLKYKF